MERFVIQMVPDAVPLYIKSFAMHFNKSTVDIKGPISLKSDKPIDFKLLLNFNHNFIPYIQILMQKKYIRVKYFPMNIDLIINKHHYIYI